MGFKKIQLYGDYTGQAGFSLYIQARSLIMENVTTHFPTEEKQNFNHVTKMFRSAKLIAEMFLVDVM